MKKNVVFIGAGSVAFHLSHALYKKGYTVSGIVSRKKTSAKKLASHFKAEYSSQFDEFITDAKIIFITTPDNEIENVAKNLCRLKLIRKNNIVIHTSGLFGVELLNCVKKSGATALSMHPGYSFPSRSYEKNELKGVRFILEGSKKAIKEGKRIVKALNGETIVIKKGKKHLYHLALVISSNLFVGLEDISLDLLTKCGIKKKDGLEVLGPLVRVTEKNIWERGTLKALTGPIERGDSETLQKHLKTLSKHGLSYRKAYIELSKHLVKMVELKGEVDKKSLRKMREILKG